MTPRDMLKLGITFLNNGQWNQQQIVSKNWIEKAQKPYLDNMAIKIPGEDSGPVGYAYSWWAKELEVKDQKIDLFWALGWGGQKIIVLPSLNAVVIFTGGNYNSGTNQFEILEKYIIPAIYK